MQGVATVVPIRRRRWPIALLIAATFLGAFGVWFLATSPEPVTSPPTPKQEAEGEREWAEESCGEKDWTTCKHHLDEAATLDPDGESEPRVLRMRQELALAMAREAGAPSPFHGGADAQPAGPGCSTDLHDILDATDRVVMHCAPDQACSAGQCLAACDAAAANHDNVGCDFLAATPALYVRMTWRGWG